MIIEKIMTEFKRISDANNDDDDDCDIYDNNNNNWIEPRAQNTNEFGKQFS